MSAHCPQDQLSGAERRRVTTLRHDADRRRFVVGALLLRAGLARCEQVDPSSVVIERSCPHCGSILHGRPRVRRPARVQVSVTHSHDLVGVAVSTAGPVGLDLELVEAHRELPARGILAPGEAVPATAAGSAGVWTAKVSALKALGVGFAFAPDQLVVEPRSRGRARLRCGRDTRTAQVTTLTPRAGTVATLTVLGATSVRVEQQWVALDPVLVGTGAGGRCDD